jgi:hypothetical protein
MALGSALTASCGEVRTPDASPVASSDSAFPDDAYGTFTGTGTTAMSTATDTFTEPFMTGTSILPPYGGSPPINCGPSEIPDGGVAAPGACSGNQYVVVPPSACANAIDCVTTLEGRLAAYALCVDGSFSICSASLPSEWVHVELPDAGDAGDAGDGV